jgi:hypothetical protein
MLRLIPNDDPNKLREIQLGAVDVLRSLLGKGETEANNVAGWIQRMTHGRVGAWCAALQYDAEATACARLGYTHPLPYSRKVHGARRLLKMIASIGRYVDCHRVAVGDYVCFERVYPRGHAARVSEVLGAGVVRLIDGNAGSFRRTRGKVREFECDLLGARLVGVARYY